MERKDYLGKKYSELTDEKNSEILYDGFTVEKLNGNVYFKFPFGIMLKSVYSSVEDIPFEDYDEDGCFMKDEIVEDAVYEECEPFDMED